MKKILCMLLTTVLMIGLLAGSSVISAEEADSFADIPEITLTYNSTRNELGDASQLEWLDGITEATGGKVTFDKYLSSSLISSPRDIPEGLASGIADIGLLNINNYPGVFPLNNTIFSIPLMGITNGNGLDILNYMYAKYPELEQEFTDAGLKLIGWNMASSVNIGLKLGHEYSSIEDIKNTKITGNGDIATEILAAAGAVPVAVAYPDIYQSLEKNVINGLLFHVAPVYDTSFYEHIDNWVIFGEDSGLLYVPVAVCMGLDTWNNLPDEVKAVFEAAEPERAVSETATQVKYNASLKEKMEEKGGWFVTMSEDQVAEWLPFVQPTAERLLSDAEATYPGFAAMYEDLCSYIAGE